MDAIVYDKVGKEAEKVREALYGIYPQAPITDAAIASFDDGADGIPVKKLVANIEPQQNLHGYESPWPAGGGKNLFNPESTSKEWVNSSMQITTLGSSKSNRIPVTAGTDVVLSNKNTASGTNVLLIAWLDSNGDVLGRRTVSSQFNYLKGTVPENCVTALVSFYTWAEVDEAQFELSTNATSYATYSNICPITGFTGANVTRTGKNLFDEEVEKGYYWTSSGSKAAHSGRSCSKNFIPVKPETTYYLKTLNLSANVILRFYNSSKQEISATDWIGTPTSGYVFTTPSMCTYLVFTFSENIDYSSNLTINYPATDTEYHPYTGNQISVIFPSSAGTVYGGTLTVNPDRTGALVVDRAYLDMGGINWDYTPTSVGHERFNNKAYLPNLKGAPSSEIANIICSIYKPVSNNYTYAHYEDKTISAGTGYIYVYDSAYTDANAFKAAMSGVQLVYEVATPITYQLTATEISAILSTLYGTNNIWADTGNIEELTYRADLGKYIDSHITTAVANALNA